MMILYNIPERSDSPPLIFRMILQVFWLIIKEIMELSEDIKFKKYKNIHGEI